MKVIPTRQETLECGAVVYSHPSLTTPGQHIVRVIDQGVDVAGSAPTRGEALDQIANYFLEIGRQIRRKAWLPDVDREGDL